jgi:hypothetical protein
MLLLLLLLLAPRLLVTSRVVSPLMVLLDVLQLEGKLALITNLHNTLVSACQALLTNTTAVQVGAESAVYAQPHENACRRSRSKLIE